MRALIATDGSDASCLAARRAVEQLRDDTEFVVVAIAPEREEAGSDAGGFEGPLQDPDDAERLDHEVIAEASAALATTARALGPWPVAQRIERGAAGPTICSLADELDADVVVIAAHTQRLFSRVLLGSVSDHVVHHCSRPVLVVPEAG